MEKKYINISNELFLQKNNLVYKIHDRQNNMQRKLKKIKVKNIKNKIEAR